MRGISKKLTSDGITVLAVHYTADPGKDPATPDGAIWKANMLKGYKGGEFGDLWQREMEGNRDSRAGQKVFPSMSSNMADICIEPFPIPADWFIYGSYDYASRGTTCFMVYAKPPKTRDYYAIWEFYERGCGYRRAAKAIKECPYYPRMEWMVADPQIWADDQEQKSNTKYAQDEDFSSIATLMANEGLYFVHGNKGKDNFFIELLNDDLWACFTNEAIVNRPQYRIFKKACPNHALEMSNLRFEDWGVKTRQRKNMKEKIVDKDNHSFDTTKYFFQRVEANWTVENIGGFNEDLHVLQVD